MAKVQDPRKKFKFTVIIPGLNPFYCQKFKAPDEEFEAAEHGEGNLRVKSVGMQTIGILSIEKIASATLKDRFIYDWMLIQKYNPVEAAYKKTIMVIENTPDGIGAIATHTYLGCFVNKLNGIEWDKVSSENTIESIDFFVDDIAHT